MSFNFRTITWCLVAAGLFISIKPMNHNWPHYKLESGETLCTCFHMEAIIEYFKDKNDLTMVLGAGDQEENYEFFNNYNFVVSNGEANIVDGVEVQDPKKWVLSSKEILQRLIRPTSDHLDASSINQAINQLKTMQKPISIPLDFNSVHFRNFLDKFPNKFKKIIFDIYSSYYTKDWDKEETAKKFFSVLQENGEFFLEKWFTGFEADKKEQLEDKSAFILPKLKMIGFEVQEKSDSMYPANRSVDGNSCYIYARKPMNLKKRIILLKESLTHLKNKLGNLQERLGNLKVALGGHK